MTPWEEIRTVERLRTQIADLEAENAALKAKVQELEAQWHQWDNAPDDCYMPSHADLKAERDALAQLLEFIEDALEARRRGEGVT